MTALLVRRWVVRRAGQARRTTQKAEAAEKAGSVRRPANGFAVAVAVTATVTGSVTVYATRACR